MNGLAPTNPIQCSTMGILEFREHLQPHLEEFLEKKTQSYAAYSGDPLLRSIWSYPLQLAHNGGKRIRPYIAYLMYSGLCDEESAAAPHNQARVLRLLVSLELFHLFCLVHDDIIDNGMERHAMPTLHSFVSVQLGRENRLRDHDHIGNAQAILLGDILFAWAQQAFHSNRDFTESTLHRAARYFGLMIDEVVIGEMLDVDMMTRPSSSFEDIEKKMLLKTASYTFIRPLQIGAALSGSQAPFEEFCYDFGFALGLAFQIQDDLLDLVGTSAATQKTIFSDLREHQHTFFTQYIFDFGTTAENEKLRGLMGRDLSADDREEILDLFEDSGAFDNGRAVIGRHLARACHLLKHSPLPLRNRDAFYELIALIQGKS